MLRSASLRESAKRFGNWPQRAARRSAEALVELHGGQICVRSEGKDRGAVFRVQLPLLPPASDQSTPRKADSATPPERAQSDNPPVNDVPFTGARLLLVEDHGDTSRLMCRLLRQYGYTVLTANTVQAALHLADQDPPELLISDIALPDGTGHDLMRQLRNRYPVTGIAISGFGAEEDIRRSREAGFTDHITKPLKLADLHAATYRALAHRQNSGPAVA